MSLTRSLLAGKAIGILSAFLVVIALCCAQPQEALAEEGESPLQAGGAQLATVPDLEVQGESDLQFVGLSGNSVTGSVSSGYTVYVRDGDTVSVDLKVKNTTGARLDYVNVTDTPSYEEDGETVEPIEFPHVYYGNITPPVENAEYDSYQDTTSDTTGIGYYGFDIEAGATATFSLNIDARHLAAGTYDWRLQLGLKRYDYEKVTVHDGSYTYDEWQNTATEVEQVFCAPIPIKVVVYAQPNASLKVQEEVGSWPFSTFQDIPSAGIDFGTIDLANTNEDVFVDARTISVYNDSPAVATDSHGNTTDITVSFFGQSFGIGDSPFSWGNIYSGYQLYLYDTKWSPLPPVGVGEGTSRASYSCVLDAAYLIAGTYTGSFVIGRVPLTLKINGTAVGASDVYRIPVKVTLTGINPRLLPRVADLVATPGNGQVELTWTPAEGGDEYAEYTIYRRVGAETQTDPDKLDWSLYEEIGTKVVGSNADLLYVDGNVENGTTYSYTVMCGSPNRGYAAVAATATPDASIQSRMMAPVSYPYGYDGYVEVSWRMNDHYGGNECDGAGMVDHFNVYRDGVLVDVIYQSAVSDTVELGWHDDGTGTQVYGPVSHSYNWVVNEPVPELYVSYNWTVSAVSPSGVESYLDEEGPAFAYGDKPVIVGHEAYFDDDYYDYSGDLYEGPAMMIALRAHDGANSPEEYKVWRNEGTAAPDTSQPVCSTIVFDGSHLADRGVAAGKTYTYTAQPVNEAGEVGDYYTFTVKAVTPSSGRNIYFETPDVEWRVLGGTTARLRFNPHKNIAASVYRNGTKLDCDPGDGYDTWYFDVKDDPGADGTYVYRVEYTYNGITESRTFTFVRNTQPVDASGLLKPPDAPTLSGRTAGDTNVILSWTPAATGGEPEGYHIYRSDANRTLVGGRYLTRHRWNGDYEYYEQWGNARYMSIEGGDTLTFVDGRTGSSSYYMGDSHKGEITDLAWDDSNMPHVYYITAYNRAGESAPSELVVFDESVENESGYPIAPPNPADEAPAAPTIERVWVDWQDSSSYRYFAPWLTGYVRVAWNDSGLGGDVDRWKATFAGTYSDQNNPPQTRSLEFYQALLDPGAKRGTSGNAPECSLRDGFGDSGDYGRTITVTVAAENSAGSSASEAVSVDVVSAPRFYALPDSGGACLRWTDLAKDAVTQVTGWEIWRRAEYGLWERIDTLPGTIGYAGTQKDYNNLDVDFYEWRDAGLENGWAYEYKVVAKCADGVDRPSVVREVTPERTAAVEAPGAPRNLTAQMVNGVINLSWEKPATGGAVAYYCPQVLGPGIDWYYGTIGSVAGNSTSATYLPRSAGTYQILVWAYCSIDGQRLPDSKLPYQVDGYDSMSDAEKAAALYSNASNIVTVTVTQADIDAQPSGSLGDFSVTLTPGDGQVAVSWTACENAVGYTVERHNNDYPKMPDVTIAAVPGQQTYTYVDETAEPGVRYRYVVTARAASGNGLYRDGYAAATGKTRDKLTAERVEALIEALPAPSDVTAEDGDQIAAVQEVWESLTAKQKALVSAELAQKLADDVDAVEMLRLVAEYSELVAPVQALIDALPDASDVTADDAEGIQAVRAAYEAIVPAEAKRIVKIERLLAAEAKLAAIADQEAADAVAKLIGALPEPEDIQLSDKPAVEEARAAFDALTESQFGYLPEHCDYKLTSCEQRIAALEKLAADTAAAQEVAGIISGLPGVEDLQLDDRAVVEAARSAYEALSDEAKEMVENYEVLVAAEAKIAALQKEVDERVAAQVDDVIAALPAPESLTLADKDLVEAARSAYEALTKDQQRYVTKLAVLEAAERRIGELEAEASEAARIDISGGAIALSPISFTYDGKAKEPAVNLVVAGETLTLGTDYLVEYARNTDAGTAQVTATGVGAYKGEKVVAFTIKKAPNTLVAKAKSKQVKASAKKLKKKKQTIKMAKAFAIANPKGTIAFKKVKGNKKIAVSKAGKITLKKKLKKGTYKVKVRVTASGDGNYQPASIVVPLKIRVK